MLSDQRGYARVDQGFQVRVVDRRESEVEHVECDWSDAREVTVKEDEVEDTYTISFSSTYLRSPQHRLLTLQHVSHMGGIREDLQEVLRRGFAGLHPRHDAARNQAGV